MRISDWSSDVCSSDLPVLIAEPGLLRHRHGRVFRRLRRITRYREKAPVELAGFGVVGADVAAHAEFGAAVADDDAALADARRAGDGVAARVIDDGVGAPDRFPGLGIARAQAATVRTAVDLHGDPTRVGAGKRG